ncbi:hypothetical protein [Thermotalea metallivorans]|uniref:Uncharacterized protein n=1 Tax=Thermotalea metallivorans TaxID=520762 RepID=A0A140L2G7_9FIRM|nr:hypothetical protein [Thermotalea metallivorans]KXG74742.1 hypothetical protein AN619_20820 [Thermotalea metallivorans]
MRENIWEKPRRNEDRKNIGVIFNPYPTILWNGKVEENSIDQCDAKKYGVIVTSGRRSGLLLSNLENIRTAQGCFAKKKRAFHPMKEMTFSDLK